MIDIPLWLLISLIVASSLLVSLVVLCIVDMIVTIVQERKYK